MPYFAKRVCDGNFTHHDLVKGVRDLYHSHADQPDVFIEAVADSLYDHYEYQKLVKKIASGEFIC